MGRPILQIVDKDDPTTLLVDLNDLAMDERKGGGFLLVEDGFDLGDVDTKVDLQDESPYPGAQVLDVKFPPAKMTITVLAKGESFKDISQRVGALHRELSKGGTFRFVPDSDDLTNTRYIDFYPAPIPAMLRDEEDNFMHVVNQFVDEGFEIEVFRHPFLRGPKVTLNPEVLQNTSTLRELQVQYQGTAPAAVKMTIAPQGSSPKLTQVRCARKSVGNVNEFATLYAFEAESATLENGTTSTTEGGRTVASTGFTTIPWMRRRWRKVQSSQNPQTLKGSYRVYAIVKGNGDGLFGIQLRWANGNRDRAEVSNRVVELDMRSINENNYRYVAVDLGRLIVDDTAITLEGWARLISGAGTLLWDEVILMPADEAFGTFNLPDKSSRTVYHGSELENVVGTRVNKENDRVLNAQYDEAQNPTPTGARYTVLPAGRYSVEVEVSLRNKALTHKRIADLEIRSAASETQTVDQNNRGALVEQVRLFSKKNRMWTKKTRKVVFDADGVTAYRFCVQQTANPAEVEDGEETAAKVHIHKMTVSVTRFVGTGESIVLDGSKREGYVLSGTGRLSKLLIKGGFIELSPGANALVFQVGESIASGYEDVVEKEALERHDASRSFSVALEVEPRYLT